MPEKLLTTHGKGTASAVPKANPLTHVIPSAAFRVREMRSRGTCFSRSAYQCGRSRFVTSNLNGTSKDVP
ncbi:MAG: hypothetical protein DMG92_06530 [Acidobacteria bacterium]|nr:MAG: hypothetical protein DMG92_06530 [Acidobacteriota bacterium]